MEKKENDPARTQLIIGILGFLGVLITALVAVFGPIIQEDFRQKNLLTQAPIIIVLSPTGVTPSPTDTVLPGTPSSTPVPDTPTPEPTFTPVPTLAAGKDWLEGCISTTWRVYPESISPSSKDGCYMKPVALAFTVRNRHLEVFYDNKVTAADVVGVFVEVPSDSLVEFTVHLDNIDTGELWMGIFGEPNLDSKGLVLGAPDGNQKNSAFVVHTMPGDKRFTTGKFNKPAGDYLVTFDVSPNSVTALLEKYTSIETVSVPSETKWLFLGYKAFPGNTNHIEGYFFDLVITPR